MRALFVKSAGIAQAMRALSRSALVALLLKLKPKTRFYCFSLSLFLFLSAREPETPPLTVVGPPSSLSVLRQPYRSSVHHHRANFFSSVHHHRFVSVSSPLVATCFAPPRYHTSHSF